MPCLHRLSRRSLRATACVLTLALALPVIARAQPALEPPFVGETHDCTQEAQAVESVVGGFYEGRLRDGTRVAINLPYEGASPTQRVFDWDDGGWWRTRDFTGTPAAVAVAGSPSSDASSGGEFVVELDGDAEDDASHRLAGTFSPDRGHASGVWSDLPDGVSQPFELTRIAEYHALHLEQAQPAGSAPAGLPAPPGGPYVFDAVWPVLPDAQVTAQARRAVTACRGSARDVLDESHVALVAWHGGDALSLHIENALMPVGGAHPGLTSSTLAFGAQAGRLQPLALADVLDPTATCQAVVVAEIRRALREQKAAFADDGGLRSGNFLPLPQGLAFVFDPADVDASYAGTRRAFVPTDAAPGCLRRLPAQE